MACQGLELTRLITKAVVSVAALLLLMAFWALLLSHNLPRSERAVAETPELSERMVIGADFEEYRGFFENYPISLTQITAGNFFNEFHKRPLYGPISASLTIVLYNIFGVTFPYNMYLILSLYSGLASILFFVVLRRLDLPSLEAGLLTAMCSLSFAWLSVFSVPESYSLSVVCVLVAMLSATSLYRAPNATLVRHGLHAVAVGLAAWVYMPICAAVFLSVAKLRTPKEWLTTLLPCTLVAIMIAFLPHITSTSFITSASFSVQQKYLEQWASVANLTDIQLVAQVACAFVLFGMIAPVEDFVLAGGQIEFTQLVSWKVVGWICLQSMCCSFLARHARWHSISGAILWLLSLFIFHVYYNPKEVLLFLSVPITVLCYIAGLTLANCYRSTVPLKNSTRLKILSAMSAALTLLIASNIGPILGWGHR
jgi:hypothetical protein